MTDLRNCDESVGEKVFHFLVFEDLWIIPMIEYEDSGNSPVMEKINMAL